MRIWCVGLVLAGALMARPAQAATIIFDVCSEALLCNQLSMTTTLTGSGTIDVSVTAPPGYGIFGSTGNNHAFGFNVAGSEAGLSVTNLTPGFTWSAVDDQISGYGIFENIVDGPQQGSSATLPLMFTVSRTGGFSSDLQLFETNAAGYIAASHLRNNTTGLTGFVAANDMPGQNTNVIPEPGTMLLLGTGLLAAARARRRRQAAAE